MKYTNARELLPESLLKEIQKYADGELLYIPRGEDKRALWGELSGARSMMLDRNYYIVKKYREGSTVDNLTDEFCLSESSIRKIICSGADALV